jgi:hypothetical protein
MTAALTNVHKSGDALMRERHHPCRIDVQLAAAWPAPRIGTFLELFFVSGDYLDVGQNDDHEEYRWPHLAG